ncbi:MAG: rhomboid family intramembrane serine protease [Victivallaceae bacterium]|nr:rhomboid family intramembrane serine protease [Victivallaceae bacterium]
MLGDRQYMNRAPRETPESGRRMLIALIVINVAAYLLIPSRSLLYNQMALSIEGLRDGYWFELVSSMFLHGSFGHIFMNMWALYVFGSLVAPILGRTRFLTLYFVSGLFGNLLWCAANLNGQAYLVGASGAIFGVMMAVALLTPNVRFMIIFFPVPIKAKTLVIVYACYEIFSELVTYSDVAHLAHLGGIVGGYVYLRMVFGAKLPWDIFRFLRPSQRPGEADFAESRKNWRNPSGPVSQHELDALLDKISRSGINSLSPDEMARLRQAREEMHR